jgi:crotonobetainyl-CoA:carnitine CoA-transferase CaiB-like acyl-CoA transferase
VAAGDALDKLVESWTQQMMPEEVQVRLQAAGVGAGLVASSKDIDADAQLNYYNFYREIDHPYMGRLRYYHPASIELSEAETAVAGPVMVGEHTDEICTGILGMSKEEIERLRQKNVFT